jgi:mannosyl-3-phosphoglycerate phosphatase
MLIFSDVDGTLLTDDGQCPLPASMLNSVTRQHQVVLASSRDVAEQQAVQRQLGWSGPLIAEVGAVVVTPEGMVEMLGMARPELLQRLRVALSTSEANELTALEPIAARHRLASLLLPLPAISRMLIHRLDTVGLTVAVGGRWATITAGAGKGAAAGVVSQRLGVPRWIAIGNGPNDASLLAEADRAFVIRNPDGHDPALARIAGAVLLAAPGPEGWLEMLRHLEPATGNRRENHNADPAVDDHHPDHPGP